MSDFKNWWYKTRLAIGRWAARTFTGIYGFDNLYFVLFGFTILLIFINLFADFWGIWLLEVATFSYMIFRAMSHNIPARRRENAAFFSFWRRVGRFFKLTKNRIRDGKTHIYRKCPKCKAVLRLPRTKGEHTAVCPRSSNRFKVK